MHRSPMTDTNGQSFHAGKALLYLTAVLAVCGPALIARNLSPSATFFNQALALGGWGAFLVALASHRGFAVPRRDQMAPVLAMGLLLLGVLMSVVLERLPASLAWSSAGLLMAAVLVLLGAVTCRLPPPRLDAFRAVCVALLVAGLCSFVFSMVQTFAPELADGDWIAKVAGHGRAGGNLRQPNHLSSLLLWSMVALVWLHDSWVEKVDHPQRLVWRIAAPIGLLALVLGDVLTASRTGIVCIVLLGLWGVADRRLSRYARVLLWAAPLAYAICWFGMTEWSQQAAGGFAGSVQLHKSDLSSSRFAIWSNALALVKDHPWLGVGWGEFNFAWSLTPFPGRPVAFFDHTHNLPLQLLVELGIPLGLLVLGLLAWSLVKGVEACFRADVADLGIVRAAMVMVLMMVVHSMLEYPLWYAYFLLPTAFAMGICLGGGTKARPLPSTPEEPASIGKLNKALVVASLALTAGAVFSIIDYTRVAAIFSADDDTPLSARIARGQKSVFFAHHADYAAVTVATHPSTAWKSFRRAPHLLLDTRLMIAWSKAYAEKGDVERARYIADRLREFRNPDSAEFFAECDKPLAAGMPAPYQCTPATRQFTYQDFKLR